MRGRNTLAHVGAVARRAPARLRRLSLGEVPLLIEAPFALPLAALALQRYGLRRVQVFLSRRHARRTPPTDPLVRRVEAARLAWIVQVVAAYSPFSANCLQRSVVLWWFLRRRGLSGELRIGVRRDEAGSLDFHAWVEHEGVPINDRWDVRQRYATFPQAIAPRGQRFH